MQKTGRLLARNPLTTGILLLAGALVWCVLFASGSVSAVSNWAPDGGDYTDGGGVFLEVSTGPNNGLDAPNSAVTIYSLIPNPQVVIHHPDHCRNGTFDSTLPPAIGWDTSFFFTGAAQTYPTGSNSGMNSIWPAASGCEGAAWVTNMSGLTPMTIGGTTFYTAVLNASIRPGASGVNAFKVSTNSGYVSFKTPNEKFALQNRAGSRSWGSYSYGDFYIKFAPDCSLAADTWTNLVSYDDDQRDGAQDNGGAGSNPIWYELREYNSGGTLTGSFSNGLAGNGNGRTTVQSFVIRPGHTYQWIWHNVSSGNGIQFQMPAGTDQIYSVAGCSPPPASMQGFFIAQDTGIVLPGTASISGVGSSASVPFSIGNIPPGVRAFTAGGVPTGFVVVGSNICRNGGSQPGIPACTPGQPSSSSGGAGWAPNSVRNVNWQSGVNYDVRWVLRPDVTCGSLQLSPPIIDVQTPSITLTATFNFGSGQAASVASSMSGGQADFGISGPVNRSGQGPLVLSGTTLTSTRSFSPALGSAGLYTFSSSLRGILASECSITRDLQVGYNPVFTVRNGDSQVGMGLQPVGSTTCTADTHAGIVSWNQGAGNYSGAGTNLGAMALSYIQGFVTNSNVALAQGPGTLAFANNAPIASGDVRYGGKFAAYQSDCMKDYYATKPATATLMGGGPIAATDDGAYYKNGSMNINGGTIGVGKHVSIYVDGDVNILNNIQFQAGPYANTGQIPALWIIATGNIYIQRDVQRLDGVYVAQGKNGVADSGAVYTCTNPNSSFNPATDSYNFNQCDDNPLVFNGSVIARRLVLIRSYGTISEAPGKYAETFNYTPLVWLGWTPTNQTTNSTQSIGGSYDAITSLPPVL